MGLPGIAQRPLTLSGKKYRAGETVPGSVMSRKLALLGLATFVPETAVAFDPGQHTVKEVLAHLDEHPEDLGRVVGAETAGEARKGLLADLDARSSGGGNPKEGGNG